MTRSTERKTKNKKTGARKRPADTTGSAEGKVAGAASSEDNRNARLYLKPHV